MSQQHSTGPGRFGRPVDSRQRCGLSRTALYEMAAADPAIFRKNGSATVVDYQRVDRNLGKLPLAKIKPFKGKEA